MEGTGLGVSQLEESLIPFAQCVYRAPQQRQGSTLLERYGRITPFVVVHGVPARSATIAAPLLRDVLQRDEAGGGMPLGQVIGATDRLGGEAVSRPVSFAEVFSTLYHNLGINANMSTVRDAQGRPHYLVDQGAQPIPELV